MKNPAKWYRRESVKLAEYTHTPIPFWLDQTLSELNSWIKEVNELNAERQKEEGR